MARFEDIEQANTEIERLVVFEAQATELSKERDELTKTKTGLESVITKNDEGAKTLRDTIGTLQTNISERDASVEALQAKVKEFETTSIDQEVHKKTQSDLETLQSRFVTNLKSRLKTGHNLPDNVLENKSIEQLEAMEESMSATKSAGAAQSPTNPNGLGMGAGGGPVTSPQSDYAFSLKQIEDAKNRS